MLQNNLTYWFGESDPRVEKYFFFNGGPEMFASVMFSWLLFVLKVGPYLMKDRKPFILREVIIIFNFALVIVNAYCAYLSIEWFDFGMGLRKAFQLKLPDRSDTSELTLWEIKMKMFFFYIKMVELLDTVFFVLRKKSNQISFLHIYHHFIVPVLGWITFKLCIQSCVFQVFGSLNSIVHVVMYSYYFLSSFGPSIQKYLWWKRYITKLQITQFLIFIVYAVLVLIYADYSDYPDILKYIISIQPFIFFFLFYQFNAQTYQKKTKSIKTN